MPLGKLIPVSAYEVIPNDLVRHQTSALIRLTPQVKPVMHLLDIRTFQFYCPYRILWKESASGGNGFQDFLSGGKDGDNSDRPPYVEVSSVSPGDLHDYIGVPDNTYSPAEEIDAWFIRAYAMFWNEYIMDPDIQTPIDIGLDDGLDTTTPENLLSINWPKDPFTTARPWKQRGDEVSISLGTSAPVESSGDGAPTFDVPGLTGTKLGPLAAGHQQPYYKSGTATAAGDLSWNDPKLAADLSSVSGITIDTLKAAFSLQRLKQRLALWGYKYKDFMRGYGVNIPDNRLQKPELLGIGRGRIQFSEVIQTAEGTGTNVGDLYGHGIGSLKIPAFRRKFDEFGCVMTLMVAMPKPEYMDSLPKMFQRPTRHDFFTPEYQFLGEQEILNKRVQASHSTPDGIFGYGPRYRSYMHIPSTVHGEMRTTRKDQHMARDYKGGDIALNSSFLTCVPTDRVFADTNVDPLQVVVHNNVSARRIVAKGENKRLIS